MSRNVADLRFAVAGDAGHSMIWRLWASRDGSVYLKNRGIPTSIKFSFHKSGICRYALDEHGASAAGLANRAIQRWRRGEIPPQGSGMYCRLARLAVPTDYLSTYADSELDSTTKIPPATAGGAAFVEVLLCRDSSSVVLRGITDGSDAGLVCHAMLPGPVYLAVIWRHGEWENRDIHMPASHGMPGYQFAANDGSCSNRPVRIAFQSKPRDGDSILITDLGGCCIAP